MHAGKPRIYLDGGQSLESDGSLIETVGNEEDDYEYSGSSLRLTFQDIVFNNGKAFFKFSVLLQLCFYSHNHAAH